MVLVDTFIAVTAMENNLMLLHNDRDCDSIAAKTPHLKILNALS
jgi:predicted nucleic acid-binding protein